MAGLFDVTPQAVRQQQAERARMMGMQRAGLPAGRGMVAAAGQAGGAFGQGIGEALGGQSPEMVKAQKIQELKRKADSSGFDLASDPEGFLGFTAREAQNMGLTDIALQVGEQLRTVQANKRKAERSSETDFMKNVKFLMNSENLSEADAIKKWVSVKRAGVKEAAEIAETKERAEVWGNKYEEAGKEAIASADKFESASRMSDLVFSEINNRGGVQQFVDEYGLQISPAGNLVQSVTALAKGVGIDLDPTQKAIFVQQLQQLNTKEALELMSKLGGSDSNEELRRVMAAIPNINDAGPAAMVGKTLLLQMTTGLDREKAILRESLLDKLGPKYREKVFQELWKDTAKTYLDDWTAENKPLFDAIGQADFKTNAKATTLEGIAEGEEPIDALLNLYPMPSQ